MRVFLGTASAVSYVLPGIHDEDILLEPNYDTPQLNIEPVSHAVTRLRYPLSLLTIVAVIYHVFVARKNALLWMQAAKPELPKTETQTKRIVMQRLRVRQV